MNRPARSLLWVLLVAVLVVAASVALGLWLLASVAHGSMSVTINGEPLDWRQLPAWQWWAASGGGLLASLLLVVAVPLSIGLLVFLGGFGLFALLAALLLALGLVAAVLLWPLWLAALLLWWLLRRQSKRADTMPP